MAKKIFYTLLAIIGVVLVAYVVISIIGECNGLTFTEQISTWCGYGPVVEETVEQVAETVANTPIA